MQALPGIGKIYKEIINDLKVEEADWKKWYDLPDPENAKELPGDLTLTKFQLLLLLRVFRPDRVLNGIRNFIVDFFDGN